MKIDRYTVSVIGFVFACLGFVLLAGAAILVIFFDADQLVFLAPVLIHAFTLGHSITLVLLKDGS